MHSVFKVIEPNQTQSNKIEKSEILPQKRQALVFQTMDSAIRRINHYPLDNSIGFAWVYPVDSAIHCLNNWGQMFTLQQLQINIELATSLLKYPLSMENT